MSKSKVSLLLRFNLKNICLTLYHYRQKQSFHSAKIELKDKISSLDDKLDKCSTTLKTKETELNEILNPEGSRVSQIAEIAVIEIYKQKISSSKDGYVYAHQQRGKLTPLLNIPQKLYLVPARLQATGYW